MENEVLTGQVNNYRTLKDWLFHSPPPSPVKSHDLPLHTSVESEDPKKRLFLFLAVKCRIAGRIAVSVKIPVGTWDCKKRKNQ